MEHLALEIFDRDGQGSRYMMLPDDTVISITDTSEIFASGDVWSLSFTLNVRANAHIFGSAGDMHGSRLHEQINKRRARLWVEGLPLFLGYLRLDDEVDVDQDGNIDVSFESGKKTFEDMIDGAKANQVPMMGDVKIGMALLQKRKVDVSMRMYASTKFTNGKTSDLIKTECIKTENGSEHIGFSSDGELDGQAVQQYPRMLFPKGDFINVQTGETVSIDYINTDYPYDDGHPYCNVALCYQKYGYDKKQGNGEIIPDYSGEPEAQRGYEYMPASRVNSAPNFYVIYWMKALMKHLGIYIEENQMMDVEDLRRLFFVNTACNYEEPKKVRNDYNERYGRFRFKTDAWTIGHTPSIVPERVDRQRMVDIKESGFVCKDYTATPQTPFVWYIDDEGNKVDASAIIPSTKIPDIEKVSIVISDVDRMQDTEEFAYKSANSLLFTAYASKECFPDTDIKEVISALESGFGIRLLFSDDYQRVRIVLLRNIFQSRDVQTVKCDIIDDSKMENSIRGFRMTYGDSDDTQFYYKGFSDKLPHKKPYFIDDSDKHDYSQWNLNAEYGDIIKKVSAFDKTCYVTPVNGDAFGIKIDKDAKRYDELHPSLFEYAGFMDAEDGDCSGDEETIETVSVNFAPAIMNDVSFEDERDGKTEGIAKQRFALFVDATMRPRRADLQDLPSDEQQAGVKSYDDPNAIYNTDKLYEIRDGDFVYENIMADGVAKPGLFAIKSDMYAKKDKLHTEQTVLVDMIYSHFMEWTSIYASWDLTNISIDGHVNEGYMLYLQDNFEPNDDGISPIETHDWGLTLGIMRGSGGDAYVKYSGDPQDEEGNDTWEITPGSSATAHHDTCNNYGEEWDYNGQIKIETREDAIAMLPIVFPDSNAPFYTEDLGYISGPEIAYIYDENMNPHPALFAREYTRRSKIGTSDWFYYITRFDGHTAQEVWQMDREGYNGISNILVEIDSSVERAKTLLLLCWKQFFVYPPPIIIDNGVGSQFGRFSLKLRAEKPDPYYDPTLPDIVTTKEDAGNVMLKIYTTSDADLLNRPVVSNAAMREAGWDAPGDGYATTYGKMYDVRLDDGKTHKILWTPIRTNSVVMTRQQLENYIALFDGLSMSRIKAVDVLNMVLDIDTTEKRAEVLHQLQALYYATDAWSEPSVDISVLRYLEIENPNLRSRGLCDTFYKEYSYWIRNARICKRKVHMELADLLKLDKTKKVRVGDITGFIRKVEYQVGIQTGLGEVTMEIMYI